MRFLLRFIIVGAASVYIFCRHILAGMENVSLFTAMLSMSSGVPSSWQVSDSEDHLIDFMISKMSSKWAKTKGEKFTIIQQDIEICSFSDWLWQ